jgi:hypothetical protein
MIKGNTRVQPIIIKQLKTALGPLKSSRKQKPFCFVDRRLIFSLFRIFAGDFGT